MARKKGLDVPAQLRFAEQLIHALDRSVGFRFWNIGKPMNINYAEGHIDFGPFSIVYLPEYGTWKLLVFVDDHETVIGGYRRIADAVVEAFGKFAKERAIALIETEVMAGEFQGG